MELYPCNIANDTEENMTRIQKAIKKLLKHSIDRKHSKNYLKKLERDRKVHKRDYRYKIWVVIVIGKCKIEPLLKML